jgi:metal-responsive CopG/Arc/MetJ family transcriptional regulator
MAISSIGARRLNPLASEGCKDIVVRNIPAQLLKDYDEAIKSKYPGGRSEAIRDHMQKTVEEWKLARH